MGVMMVHPRAFIKTGIRSDNLDPDLTRALAIIRVGFNEARRLIPRRAPPAPPTDDKFKPPVKSLRAGQVLKPRKEPANLNRHNPGRILRIYSFDDHQVFPGRQIFVEVNQKKMTRPKFWTTMRQQDKFQAEIATFLLQQRQFFRQKNYRRAGAALRNSTETAYHMLLTLLHGYSCPKVDNRRLAF
ncbi:hypothetical protein [Paremcibacter congregatus]|uniref:Uncharacterized protein n=1 Tax=Paremcibacter congregatus TaxID=2043170 RepID=A0A2G4YNS1_9PROT|nr:hypothetical protein [Paremcibacter congregatus]PHZ83935.1 hypothetical protein CRD36_14475 [Paremcibacter congregatus]QDE28975.1 hypothetical protein FIV45_17665 [Paremcibacter congregatus]